MSRYIRKVGTGEMMLLTDENIEEAKKAYGENPDAFELIERYDEESPKKKESTTSLDGKSLSGDVDDSDLINFDDYDYSDDMFSTTKRDASEAIVDTEKQLSKSKQDYEEYKADFDKWQSAQKEAEIGRAAAAEELGLPHEMLEAQRDKLFGVETYSPLLKRTKKEDANYLLSAAHAFDSGVVGVLEAFDNSVKSVGLFMGFDPPQSPFTKMRDELTKKKEEFSPDTYASHVLNAVSEMTPEIIAFNSLLPSISTGLLAAKTGNKISHIPKFPLGMGAKEFANAYTSGDNLFESMEKGADTWATVSTWEMLGVPAGTVKNVVHAATRSSLAAESASAVTAGGLFGLYSVTEDVINGNDINWEKASEDIGVGIALHGKQLVNSLAAQAQNQATNSFSSATPEVLRRVYETNKTTKEIRKEAIVRFNKATSAPTEAQRRILLTEAQQLHHYADVKAVVTDIKENGVDKWKNELKNRDNLSDVEKKYFEEQFNFVENLGKKDKEQPIEGKKVTTEAPKIDKKKDVDIEKEDYKFEDLDADIKIAEKAESKEKEIVSPEVKYAEGGSKKVISEGDKNLEVVSIQKKRDGSHIVKAKYYETLEDGSKKYGTTRRFTGDVAEGLAKDMRLGEPSEVVPKTKWKTRGVPNKNKKDADTYEIIKSKKTEKDWAETTENEINNMIEVNDRSYKEVVKDLEAEQSGKISDLEYLFVEHGGKEYLVRKSGDKYAIKDVKTDKAVRGDKLRTDISAEYDIKRNTEEVRIREEMDAVRKDLSKDKEVGEDKILQLMDNMIKATDTSGKAYDATLGLPLFVVNSSLKLVRASYKGGKKLVESVNLAIEWLKKEGYKVNEVEYKKFVRDNINKPIEQIEKEYYPTKRSEGKFETKAEIKPKTDPDKKSEAPSRPPKRTRRQQVEAKHQNADDINAKHYDKIMDKDVDSVKKSEASSLKSQATALRPQDSKNPNKSPVGWESKKNSIISRHERGELSYMDAARELRDVSEEYEAKFQRGEIKSQLKGLGSGKDQRTKNINTAIRRILGIENRHKKAVEDGLIKSSLEDFRKAEMDALDAEIEKLMDSDSKAAQDRGNDMALAKEALMGWENMSSKELGGVFDFIKQEKSNRVNRQKSNTLKRHEQYKKDDASISEAIYDEFVKIKKRYKNPEKVFAKGVSRSRMLRAVKNDPDVKKKLKGYWQAMKDAQFLKTFSSNKQGDVRIILPNAQKKHLYTLQTFKNILFGDKKSEASDIVDGVAEANNNKKAIVDTSMDSLMESLGDIYGVKKNKQGGVNRRIAIKKLVKDASKELYDIPLKTPTGETEMISINTDAAMNNYLWWKNPDARSKMEKSGWTEESYNAMVNKMSPESKRAADAMQEIVSKFENPLYEITKEYHGSFKRQPNYWRVTLDKSTSPAKDVISEEIGGYVKSMTKSMLQSRVTHEHKLDYEGGSAIKTFNGIVEDASSIMANHKIERRVNNLMKNKEVREVTRMLGIDAAMGDSFKNALGIKTVKDPSGFGKAVNFVASSIARNSLAFKVWQMPKQWTSFVAGRESYVPTKGSMLPASAQFFGEAMKSTVLAPMYHKQMYAESSLYRSRWNNWYRANIDASVDDIGLIKRASRVSEITSAMAMYPTKMGDAWGIISGYMPVYKSIYRDVYKREVANGVGDTKAAELAQEAALKGFEKYDQTQQSQNKANRAGIQEIPYIKHAALYKSSNILYFNKVQQAKGNIAKNIREHGSIGGLKKSKKDIGRILIYRQLTNTLFAAMGGLPAFYLRDDEDVADDFWRNVLISNVTGNSGAFVFGGQSLYNFVSTSLGGGTFDAIGTEGVLVDMVESFGRTIKKNNKRKELDEAKKKAWKEPSIAMRNEMLDDLKEARAKNDEELMYDAIEAISFIGAAAGTPSQASYEMIKGGIDYFNSIMHDYDLTPEERKVKQKQAQKQMGRFPSLGQIKAPKKDD